MVVAAATAIVLLLPAWFLGQNQEFIIHFSQQDDRLDIGGILFSTRPAWMPSCKSWANPPKSKTTLATR